jgi:hypothetical protein
MVRKSSVEEMDDGVSILTEDHPVQMVRAMKKFIEASYEA